MNEYGFKIDILVAPPAACHCLGFLFCFVFFYYLLIKFLVMIEHQISLLSLEKSLFGKYYLLTSIYHV